MSVNKVILVGNVGKDPVVRYFDKGVAKATFPLATSESYNNQQGETITTTEWHNIVLWRALAEVAEKTVRKGSQVYIVGKIKTRSYVDKDGNNKYITEILADSMMVLEKKTGTYPSGGDSTREVRQPEVNDQGSDYSAGKSNNMAASADNDTPFGNGTPADFSEDDLPF